MKLVGAATFATCLMPASLAFAAGGALSDARIALRCADAKLLIVGANLDDDRVGRLNLKGALSLALGARFSPGEATFEISERVVTRLTSESDRAGFRIGARWRVYPGAGPSVPVVIAKLVLLYHGDGSKYLGAIAQFLNTGTANRIQGLAAREYLALPGVGISALSQIPMVPLDKYENHDELTRILFERAREVVHDSHWEMENTRDPQLAERIEAMNRALLERTDPYTQEIRMWRWTPGGGKAFFLIEAFWVDDERRQPIFAVDAVVEAGKQPKIVSFDYYKARFMRVGEFQERNWRPDSDEAPFLNAWKLGSEYFLLTWRGGEGYSVSLERLDSSKGLQEVLGFGQ